MNAAANPTKSTYDRLQKAYDAFNRQLFAGELPPCMITMRRRAKCYGYFAPQRIGSRDGSTVHDEIALNPTHFAKRTTEQSLSTLAHEMAHLWQQHFGQPSRSGYHNKQWAEKMIAIGLIPSHTGEPGGRQTGQQMTHYIEPGGAYQRAYNALAKAFGDLFVDRWDDEDAKAKKAKAKSSSKTKFTCESCDANAWGKPDLHLVCGDCGVRMVDQDAEAEPVEVEVEGGEDDDEGED